MYFSHYKTWLPIKEHLPATRGRAIPGSPVALSSSSRDTPPSLPSREANVTDLWIWLVKKIKASINKIYLQEWVEDKKTLKKYIQNYYYLYSAVFNLQHLICPMSFNQEDDLILVKLGCLGVMIGIRIIYNWCHIFIEHASFLAKV